ncbi:helix-turn-helix domain-containing protein [Cohnella zeiphila]|uniref:AraC family transcriptional regulator n=1 Tax=Cohnella zeiphila TaxID=2761120 RepID=A0A7X0SIQ8_9BACL|nr:helix-turn-helix domain-containing protein [Cohnella zeiphila]MBB6730730.1 AraC family transcriptional regulator [Cohnella zeiphila]
MNRTWFTRMLLSYVPAFFILTAFLFFIFFKMLSDSNAAAARKSNDFVARQAQLVIDSSLAAIDQKITLEMLRNRTVLQYFTEPSVNDLTLQVGVMNELSEWKIANPLIHSVYMVRTSDRTVLNLSTTYPLDQYSDAPFIESAMRSPNGKWSDIRTYKELPSEKGTPVVTLTRRVSIFSGKYGLIVVNVNAAALQALVREMYDPAATRLRLYDNKGNDLFAASGDSPPAPAESGAMASESVSDYTGWHLVSELKNARMIQWLLSTFDVWFVSGLVVCAIALGWIVWMTRQNYRPIRTLVTQLRSYSADGKPEGRPDGKIGFAGEFQFINSAVEQMFHQNNRFQLQLQEDLKVKRNFFMYELLEGMRQIRMEEWEEAAARHGWPRTFGKARIAVLEIDGAAAWRRTYAPDEQDEWKQAIEAIVARRAEESGRDRVWQLWTGFHQLAVILMSPSGLADEDMLAVIRGWHGRIREEVPFPVSIGLGEPVEHPDNIHDAYQEALEALQYKAVEGGDRLLAYRASNPDGEHPFGHLKRIETIVDRLRLSDGKWRTELRALFRQLEQDRSPRDEIDHAMNYLIFNLNKAIDGMGEEFKRQWLAEWMPVLHKALDEAELLSEISRVFFETLERFEEAKERSRDSRSQGNLIKEIKSYIESDYANPALSLDYLSEKFGISGKYLSRLFKEEFGLKFVDFLIDQRIRQARKLLSETNDSVQEIAERLGYSSPISFARTFKKIVGLPPGDYRRETQSS